MKIILDIRSMLWYNDTSNMGSRTCTKPIPSERNMFMSRDNKKDLQEYMNVVSSYLLRNHGCIIRFTNEDKSECCYLTNLNRICISKKQSLSRQLYSLLHEAGHCQLRRSNKKYLKRQSNNKTLPIPYYSFCNNPNYMISSINQLQEEFKAWELGYTIATKLSIPININQYNRFATKCLNTYIKQYHDTIII